MDLAFISGLGLIVSHNAFALTMAYHCITLSRKKLRILLSIFMAMAILQYKNKGCFITRYERALTGIDYTIIDPLLWIFGKETSNRNRYEYTITSSMIGILYLLIRYHPQYQWIMERLFYKWVIQ